MDATQPVWICGCNIPHYALTDADKGKYTCPFGCGQTYGVPVNPKAANDTQADANAKSPQPTP